MAPWFRFALLLCTLSACAGALKYELRGTDLSPGSDAKLEAKVNNARNLTELNLKATNLTPPNRVVKEGTTYVVWTRRDKQSQWVRLGALELTDDGRTGSATLTVSEVAFDLQVSAEENAEVASPSGKAIFEQRVQE
jgi:hypothetical protein